MLSDGVDTYVFDWDDRMVSATAPTDTEAYSYNDDGIRVQTVTTTSAGTTVT